MKILFVLLTQVILLSKCTTKGFTEAACKILIANFNSLPGTIFAEAFKSLIKFLRCLLNPSRPDPEEEKKLT